MAGDGLAEVPDCCGQSHPSDGHGWHLSVARTFYADCYYH